MVENPNNIFIFDRNQLRNRRKRAAKTIENYSFLIDWTNQQLTDRLQDIKRSFPVQLQMNAQKWQINTENTPHHITADEELPPLKPESLNLIQSTLNLHSVNDLPGTLLQIRQSLKPDGLFLAAMFGGETLHELRQAFMETELKLKGGVSPRIFPFADKQQTGALLQRAGFSLPVVDSEIITVTYKNMFKLLEDLRGMGEGNIIHERSRTNPGKQFFMDAAEHYAQNFSDKEGRIKASFEIIFMIGWAPHQSQQKPLRPGSAQTRLSKALNTDEIKTGEKALP